MSVSRVRMIVEGFNPHKSLPGRFVDCSQHNRLQNLCTLNGLYGAAHALSSIRGFEISLAPLVPGVEQADHLVDSAHPIVESEPDTIERHGFASSSTRNTLDAPLKRDNTPFDASDAVGTQVIALRRVNRSRASIRFSVSLSRRARPRRKGVRGGRILTG